MKFYALFKRKNHILNKHGLKIFRVKDFSPRRIIITLRQYKHRLRHCAHDAERDAEAENKQVIQVNESIIDPRFLKNKN